MTSHDFSVHILKVGMSSCVTSFFQHLSEIISYLILSKVSVELQNGTEASREDFMILNNAWSNELPSQWVRKCHCLSSLSHMLISNFKKTAMWEIAIGEK